MLPGLLSIVTGLGEPGAVGSKVTSRPLLSTAVHWLADGHAIARRSSLLSMGTGLGVPGAVGSNVTSRPAASTTVHWLAEGHATAFRALPPLWSSAIGPDHDRAA